jgi:hypothetical protein
LETFREALARGLGPHEHGVHRLVDKLEREVLTLERFVGDMPRHRRRPD